MDPGRDPAIEGMMTPFNGFISRVGRLPLSIIEGISRAIGNVAPTMGPQNLQPSQHDHQPLVLPEEWLFLSSFERQFGSSHPFFYATKFTEALKIAKDESKFIFVYLHDPEHPYTAPFCHGTLCSSLVVEFLDANFVSWGAVANTGEGLKMAMGLKASSFPFCAIVAPASGDGDSISILRKAEGPVSPEELVEILQRTIEEQGPAFRSRRAQEEEKLQADRRLREEQDAAYRASLEKDKEKEAGVREVLVEEGVDAAAERRENEREERIRRTLPQKQPIRKTKEGSKVTKAKEKIISRQEQPITKIRIRFPNGKKNDQSFLSTDTIQSIYKYVDSLDLPGVGGYRLLSNFPRKVYGYDQLQITLKDAGLHPTATLYLELFH